MHIACVVIDVFMWLSFYVHWVARALLMKSREVIKVITTSYGQIRVAYRNTTWLTVSCWTTGSTLLISPPLLPEAKRIAVSERVCPLFTDTSLDTYNLHTITCSVRIYWKITRICEYTRTLTKFCHHDTDLNTNSIVN